MGFVENDYSLEATRLLSNERDYEITRETIVCIEKTGTRSVGDQVMNEMTATRGQLVKAHTERPRVCSGVQRGVHHRRGSAGSRAHRASGAR